jgi:hypothetical protein
MSLLDMVQQQLGGNAVNTIAQQIGASPQQTSSAIDMALPVIMGGLAQNAERPEGAESLNRALDDHTGTLDQVSGFLGGLGGGGAAGGASGGLGGLGGLINSMGGGQQGAGAGGGGLGGMMDAFGGGQQAGGGGIGGALGGLLGGAVGGKILGHILGGRQPQAQDAIAQKSGLDAQQVGKLLMVLAPIVMGVLAKRKQQAQLDTGGLQGELQQTRQQAQQRAQQPDNPLGAILGQVFGR